ncbi:MAG: hypothetical protein HY694_03635 [Deltaproteobacteria bacterium]|nr:hypothetical protein [Deltaproteobacteria bacterium]
MVFGVKALPLRLNFLPGEASTDAGWLDQPVRQFFVNFSPVADVENLDNPRFSIQFVNDVESCIFHLGQTVTALSATSKIFQILDSENRLKLELLRANDHPAVTESRLVLRQCDRKDWPHPG